MKRRSAKSTDIRGARAAAQRALQKWRTSSDHADEVLRAVVSRSSMEERDRGFAMELFYAVLRNLRALDCLIAHARDGSVDAGTHDILRIGLVQIFFLGISGHAAVNETVKLADRSRGLVNAILRRALREEDAFRALLASAPPPVRLSHPDILWTRWEARWGASTTETLCRWNNEPAPLYARMNGLKVSRDEFLRRVPGEPLPNFPSVMRVDTLPHAALDEGLCYMQDPSTLLACQLLSPSPEEWILDACAAPGGKTIQLAELMQNRGKITATDADPDRLKRLQGNLARLGVRNAEVRTHDWTQQTGLQNATFDAALLDVPCSNTGVLRRRVDARWRLSVADFERMPRIQGRILRQAAKQIRSGGRLVYSTCSIEPEENEQVVEAFLRENGGFELLEQRALFPVTDQTDGAFAALLRRK